MPTIQANNTNKNGTNYSTAILFLIFNRPETTMQVFESIRSTRPRRLYVAADGPRPNSISDHKNCAKARKIATAIDWPCDIKTLFRDDNHGCQLAVSRAIDWFFEFESEGIILEDDCVPDGSFFTYTQDLLAYYKNDERIMVIGAQHFPGKEHNPDHSYFFSRYNHCWGWATWRRSWQHYDQSLLDWPILRKTNWLLRLGNGSRPFQEYWTDVFDRTYAGEIDTWAYRWTYSCWRQSGFTILPGKNLVTNIGFNLDATHTTDEFSASATLPLESLKFPLSHPEKIVQDLAADQWTDRHHFGISWVNLIKRKLERGFYTLLGQQRTLWFKRNVLRQSN